MGKPNNSIVWTDSDVAAFFHISKKTLQDRMRRPVEGELQLSLAEPGVIGGRRYWLRDKVISLVKGAIPQT